MKTIVPVRSLLAAVLVGLALFVPHSSGQEQAGTVDGLTMELDEETEVLSIRISAQDGQVAWSDILRALLRTGQFDDSALLDQLPTGKLDLNLTSSRFLLMGLNAALSPDLKFSIVPAATGESQLLVKVDQAALREKQRSVNRLLREKLRSSSGEKFGLQLPEGWQQTDEKQLLVVVVHGFNSSPLRFAKLVKAFQKAKLVSGTYSYPDDQPIADSAAQFSIDLQALAAKHPERKIALVTHSMGGLVSRAVVEDPQLDPGNVSKLIMVAPPSHGSLLANYSYGIDILDQASSDVERGDASGWHAALADGMNEAADDLIPGSRFLRTLNTRARNPKIAYSLILGTGGRVSKARLEGYRQQLRTTQAESQVTRLLTPSLDKILADLEEVQTGKGDDFVAVKRGRLAGVDDTILLKFTHLEALQNENKLEGDELYEAVLARLRR